MTDQPMPGSITASVRDNWFWFLALGNVFIVGGLFAFFSPFIAGFVVTTVVAAVMAIVGVVQIIQAWQMKSWAGFLWQLIIGVVILIGGIAIYTNPVAGLFTLTLLVAAFFIAKGIFQIVLGFRLRPNDAWGWIVAAGVLAILVGLMIWSEFPFSATYALGVLAGVSLTFTGWSYVMIALAGRRMA